MSHAKQRMLIVFIPLLFFCSIFLQFQLPVHWDLIYILEAGKRLLAGGTLFHDAFDPNPPLIFYMSELVNVLAQVLHLSNVWLFKTIQYVSIIYALSASYFLLPKTHREWVILTLAVGLLILPSTLFAEREHWMIALVMPYFFLSYQGAHDVKYHIITRVVITATAAFGFCLKPYFLLSFLCSELMLVSWKRDWRWVFRLESVIFLLVVTLYLMFIRIYVPDYFHQMLPRVMQWYAFNNNPLFVLKHEVLLSFIILTGCFVVSYRKMTRIEKLLYSVAFGFAVSFVLQGKGWLYHAIPLMIVMMMLVVLFICNHRPIGLFLLCIQGLFILLPIGCIYYQQISCYRDDHCSFKPLVDVVRSEKVENQSIFFFTTLMSESLPVIYYAPAHFSSRFPYMWLLSGIINREQEMGWCDEQCKEGMRYVRESVNEDLQQAKPLLVFVDIQPLKAYFSMDFDYLKFMKTSSSFRAIWKHYCYLNTVNHYAIYRRC